MPTCLPEDYNKYKHLLESEHFLKWCKDIKYPDDESIYGLEEFYWKFCEKEKKKILKDSKERVAQYCFLTLQNFLCKPEHTDQMILFIKKVEYLYEHGWWIIETGKSDNLHIHMLVKIIDPKRHKRKLNIEWNKIFGKEEDMTKLRTKSLFRATKGIQNVGTPHDWEDYEKYKKEQDENKTD